MFMQHYAKVHTHLLYSSKQGVMENLAQGSHQMSKYLGKGPMPWWPDTVFSKAQNNLSNLCTGSFKYHLCSIIFKLRIENTM